MKEKEIILVLMIGSIVSTISIIVSVDYLFKEKRYMELAFASITFMLLILVARKLKADYQRLQEIEELEELEQIGC